MRKISQSQIKILKKVSMYNARDFSLASYFCSYAYNLGFYQMKFWNNNKNIFKLIFVFFKEIYSIINASDYEVRGNLSNLSNFKSIVVTWGNDDNIKNKLFSDKYFNSSSKNNSVLWVVIFSGKKTFLKDNVLVIIKKKISFYIRFKNFISFFFSLFKKKKIYISLHIITLYKKNLKNYLI